MGVVTLLPTTTKNPISLIGERAGVCWNANTQYKDKNYLRGIDCIKSNHGRTLEFVNVEMILDGYSARVIREWYTHIGGAPTRLQASTRYINYSNFQYIIPKSIKPDSDAYFLYEETMKMIAEISQRLETEYSIPREDAAMLLPLGMATKVVCKHNLRNLVDMSRNRECNRAYWEFRELFADVKKALCDYSSEWQTTCDMLFMPKCKAIGYCPEKKSCGLMPQERK